MTAKSYTEEEIREIAARQGLAGYPHLALMREKLSVKAEIPITPVSHGKPYAGNPHVRFEEGASALDYPRRNALLHRPVLGISETRQSDREIRRSTCVGQII